VAVDYSHPENIGVINPFALVELRLRQQINWSLIPDPASFVGQMLGVPYNKLFDPATSTMLYPGLRFDAKAKRLVPDAKARTLPQIHGLPLGGGGAGTEWARPQGVEFFTAPVDFIDPVQGAIPDCHFISALAALAWSRPYSIAQRTRPLNGSDSFAGGSAVDMIQFYTGTGSASSDVEVTELLPLIEPGDGYIYARCVNPTEIWPSVYEKAWVKWVTQDTSDQPNYGLIGGGDPIADLVTLTGLSPNYVSTQGVAPQAIWNDVRSHCDGSWTFDPMAAWTYPSAAAAPTPINYSTANLVAWHVYAILGWMYDDNSQQEYIVLRNPWGNTEAVLNVDDAPWFSMEQIPAFFQEKFGEGDFARSFSLPGYGVFALRADTFQQYFSGYGWVS
jgi:Calpain family cysteine protease